MWSESPDIYFFKLLYVNFRIVCSPSHRYRLCTNHCIQVLVIYTFLILLILLKQVGRLLLFLTSCNDFRKQLTKSLKNLIQLIDPILDPQVLCLLLQVTFDPGISIQNIHEKLNIKEQEQLQK